MTRLNELILAGAAVVLLPMTASGQNWTEEELGLIQAIEGCWESFETDRSMEGFVDATDPHPDRGWIRAHLVPRHPDLARRGRQSPPGVVARLRGMETNDDRLVLHRRHRRSGRGAQLVRSTTSTAQNR